MAFCAIWNDRNSFCNDKSMADWQEWCAWINKYWQEFIFNAKRDNTTLDLNVVTHQHSCHGAMVFTDTVVHPHNDRSGYSIFITASNIVLSFSSGGSSNFTRNSGSYKRCFLFLKLFNCCEHDKGGETTYSLMSTIGLYKSQDMC